MRIHLKIQADQKLIPFDHQPLLVGTIHKWLRWNEEHDKVSLYSFSRLEGGKATKGGLRFDQNCSFFFSSHKMELIQKLISGIQSDPSMFNELTVKEILIQEDPDLSKIERFNIGSPIFIKRRNESKIDHILYTDPRSSELLKETLHTKMQEAGITDDSLEIYFDTSYQRAGTKMITYNGIKNRTNWCPVIIKGKPETKVFAWNCGIGNSTGIGLGAIK